jgi:hypothetical protein
VSRATTGPAETGAEERKAFRPVARVGVRLRRDCANEGSAHGTMQPTARNLDCTATPHCCASRSQAQIEYVATTGLAVGHLREVE